MISRERAAGAPEEQPGDRRTTVILGLVAASALLLLIPLYLVRAAVQSDAAGLQAEMQAVQQTLENPGPPDAESQELADELARVQGALKQVKEARSAVTASHTDWPAVIEAIGSYNPTQLTLSSVSQADRQITVKGRAVDDSVVVAYSRDLEQTHLFSRVVVQSMRAIATPFATPASPADPSDATATPTPVVTSTRSLHLGDEYEVDDFEPSAIFLGQTQVHTFHPIHDVDRVKFLAKAGRYYRVSTAALAPGVDTVVTVSLGDATYTNDDSGPGELRSEVGFQVSDRDAEAVVRVANRGRYGADKQYELTVEEVVPTATPTPAPPTATPTPAPVTTTPDPRDEYEPDDVNPRPIALGETQAHNFYPDGDVDRLEFLAKAGRWYRVSTSGLEPGVDTFVAVILGDTTYISDDRDPGDLSSEVVFQVGAEDVNAIVKVTNRQQYGSDKWYRVALEEILPTPTATPTPTPTATPESVPTSTPDPRDEYEPDEAGPGSIAIGETQIHNFTPEGDVDQVEFLAKAGRWYRVSTSDLTLGVDTDLRLTLALSDTTYYTSSNDDRGPGDLGSEITFRTETSFDVDALARIANRGQYGPDKEYQITVEEVFPELMAVGETQRRTFLDGVEDMVRFEAKAGRWYAVSTADLAVGVDTYLRVTVDGELMGENDDVAAGSYASEVRFLAPSDSTVVVLIANLQEDYGPRSSYDITVEEVGPTPTPASSSIGTPPSSLRPPGMASPVLCSAADGRYSWQTVTIGMSVFRISSLKRGIAASPLASDGEAVEFVIVLELPGESDGVSG